MNVCTAPRQRLLGAEEWETAARQAAVCATFRPDVEEEQVADEAVSCYNCRYRRWAVGGIACLADPG